MTIRTRLKMVGILPIIFLIFLSGYFFVTSYLNFEKANALQTILKNNATLNKSLVELGKERGLSSLYLGTQGKEFSDVLKKQRTKTDRILKDVKSNLVYKDTSSIPVLLTLLGEKDYVDDSLFMKLLGNINTLAATRKNVDMQNKDFKKIFFEGYTDTLTTPTLNAIAELDNFTLNTNISSLISSLLQLTTAKENASLERDFISYYMTKKSSMSFDEIALWDHFKTKANGFDLERVDDNILRNKLKDVFNSAKAKEILSDLAATSSAIQTDTDNGDYAESAVDWFTLQTKKVDLLSKAEVIVANTLWEESAVYLKNQIILLSIASILLLIAFILGIMGYRTTRDISRNI